MLALLEPTKNPRKDAENFLNFSVEFIDMLVHDYSGVFYEEAILSVRKMAVVFITRIESLKPSACSQPLEYYELHGLYGKEWAIKAEILSLAFKRFRNLSQHSSSINNSEITSLETRHAANWVLDGINTILKSLLDPVTGGAATEAKDMIHSSLKLYF